MIVQIFKFLMELVFVVVGTCCLFVYRGAAGKVFRGLADLLEAKSC